MKTNILQARIPEEVDKVTAELMLKNLFNSQYRKKGFRFMLKSITWARNGSDFAENKYTVRMQSYMFKKPRIIKAKLL